MFHNYYNRLQMRGLYILILYMLFKVFLYIFLYYITKNRYLFIRVSGFHVISVFRTPSIEVNETRSDVRNAMRATGISFIPRGPTAW